MSGSTFRIRTVSRSRSMDCPTGTTACAPAGSVSTRVHVSSGLHCGHAGFCPVGSQSSSFVQSMVNVCEQCDCVRQISPGLQLAQLVRLQSPSDTHGWLVVWEQCWRSNCVVLASLTPPTLSDSAQLSTSAPRTRKLHGGRSPSRWLAFFKRIVRSTVLVPGLTGSYMLRFGDGITCSLGLGAHAPVRTAIASHRALPST